MRKRDKNMDKNTDTPKPRENYEVSAVRPKHTHTGTDTRSMVVRKTDIIALNYQLDVVASDLFYNRAEAIETYAQMAAARVREMLTPIEVRST